MNDKKRQNNLLSHRFVPDKSFSIFRLCEQTSKRRNETKPVFLSKMGYITFQSLGWSLILMISLYILFSATELTYKLSESGLIFSCQLQTSTELAVIKRILLTGYIQVTRSILWGMKKNEVFQYSYNRIFYYASMLDRFSLSVKD